MRGVHALLSPWGAPALFSAKKEEAFLCFVVLLFFFVSPRCRGAHVDNLKPMALKVMCFLVVESDRFQRGGQPDVLTTCTASPTKGFVSRKQ